MSEPLKDKVALVAGATRGAGRAIALELALAGATVYATGRTSAATAGTRSAKLDSESAFDLTKRRETIEQTAELIAAAGGTAVPVCVDHTQPAQVQALCERIERERGRIDIVINDIWGGDALTEWGVPFWKLDVERGFKLLERAIHTHVITSRYAGPLLQRSARGLIVEVTDGTGFYYRTNLFYDLVKTSVCRLAFAMAEELRGQPIAAVAVSPGFLRSEAMLDHLDVSEDNWRDAIAKDPHFAQSETPRFVGRGIAALAADPDLLQKSGRGFGSWHLGAEYGVVDVDGTRPDWGAHAAKHDFGRDQAESDLRFRAMFEVPKL